MSGLSTSFTFPLDGASAPSLVRAIENGDYSSLDRWIGRDCLHASSRNNWVEGFVHGLVEEFDRTELAHLASGWDENGSLKASRFVVELRNGRLSEAIAGLRLLLSCMESQPARCASALNGIYTEGEILEELQAVPATPSHTEAIHRYRVARSYGDGDDFLSLVTFLRAHLSVLEFARACDKSAIYVVGLY